MSRVLNKSAHPERGASGASPCRRRPPSWYRPRLGAMMHNRRRSFLFHLGSSAPATTMTTLVAVNEKMADNGKAIGYRADTWQRLSSQPGSLPHIPHSVHLEPLQAASEHHPARNNQIDDSDHQNVTAPVVHEGKGARGQRHTILWVLASTGTTGLACRHAHQPCLSQNTLQGPSLTRFFAMFTVPHAIRAASSTWA